MSYAITDPMQSARRHTYKACVGRRKCVYVCAEERGICKHVESWIERGRYVLVLELGQCIDFAIYCPSMYPISISIRLT